MKVLRSSLALTAVLMLGSATTAMAQCALTAACSATSTCQGACAGGIVGISHQNFGFAGSGFDLTASTVYANSCNTPTLPGGCPVQATPPLRWWSFDRFGTGANGANSGCVQMFQPNGDSYISSKYDTGNTTGPLGIWWLQQAQWAGSTGPGSDRVDGCISAGAPPFRTVAEISFADAASGEGTAAHDSWFMIAGAGADNTGASIYDFEGITMAGGPNGNIVALASVPDLTGITNADTTGGRPVPSCPGNYTGPSQHPANAVSAMYFDVAVTVSNSSPAYFNEAGMNSGAQLVAGLQILYARTPAPTTSAVDSPADIATAVWLPTRDPAAPATNVAGIIPFGAATSITVSLPLADCPVTTGCYLAARILYTDSLINPGLPGPGPIAMAPRLGSWTGRHCGPVTIGIITAVNFDQVSATRTADGVRVSWTTSMEDDVFGFKVFRASDPTSSAGFEASSWTDAVGPGHEYTVLDTEASATGSSWYYVQEVTSEGLGQRSMAVRVTSPDGRRTPDGGRDRR